MQNNHNIEEVVTPKPNIEQTETKRLRGRPKIEKSPKEIQKRGRTLKTKTEEYPRENQRPGRPRTYPEGTEGKPLIPNYFEEYVLHVITPKRDKTLKTRTTFITIMTIFT